MTQTTARLGAVNNVGTSYVNVFTVPALTVDNLMLNVTNRSGAAALLRAYLATATWTTGEPTGSTLVAAIAYDTPLTAGQVFQIPFIVFNAGEQLVVRSSVANGLDIIASGIAIT